MFTINEFGRRGETIILSESGKVKTRFSGEKVFEIDKECYEAFSKFRFDVMHDGRFMHLPCCITATNRDDHLSVLSIWYGRSERGMWVDVTIDGEVHPLINPFGKFSMHEEDD